MSRVLRLKDLPPNLRAMVKRPARSKPTNAEKQLRREEAAFRRRMFFEALDRAGIERPEWEYEFHPHRRWRFDYAWPNAGRLALEVDGGLFVNGRHNRGEAMIATMEKMNTAASEGWRVLYTTPDKLTSKVLLHFIRESLEHGS